MSSIEKRRKKEPQQQAAASQDQVAKNTMMQNEQKHAQEIDKIFKQAEADILVKQAEAEIELRKLFVGAKLDEELHKMQARYQLILDRAKEQAKAEAKVKTETAL